MLITGLSPLGEINVEALHDQFPGLSLAQSPPQYPSQKRRRRRFFLKFFRFLDPKETFERGIKKNEFFYFVLKNYTWNLQWTWCSVHWIVYWHEFTIFGVNCVQFKIKLVPSYTVTLMCSFDVHPTWSSRGTFHEVLRSTTAPTQVMLLLKIKHNM